MPKQDHLRGTSAVAVMFVFGFQSVGGLAAQICRLLQGKHRVDYSPLKVSGDSVVVVNAIHAKFSGHTWDTKIYRFPRKSERRKL